MHQSGTLIILYVPNVGRFGYSDVLTESLLSNR